MKVKAAMEVGNSAKIAVSINRNDEMLGQELFLWKQNEVSKMSGQNADSCTNFLCWDVLGFFFVCLFFQLKTSQIFHGVTEGGIYFCFFLKGMVFTGVRLHWKRIYPSYPMLERCTLNSFNVCTYHIHVYVRIHRPILL